MKHIQSSMKRRYNSEKVMLKIMEETTVAITNNTIIEAKEITFNNKIKE